MGLTLAQIFGANAVIDDSTPTAPKLVIDLRNLQNVGTGTGELSGNGLDDATDITAANGDTYASKILASIVLLHKQKQPATNDDNTVGTYVDFDPNRNKRFATRNSTSQIEWQPRVLIYQDDPTSTLDSDNVK